MAMLTAPTTIPVAFAGSDMDSASTIIPDDSRGAPLTFVKRSDTGTTGAVALAAGVRPRPDPRGSAPPEKRAVSSANGAVTGV